MEILFKEINEFLKGNRTYQQGVELYKQYGKNSALNILFTTGEDAYSRSKLKTALADLLPTEVSNVPKTFEVFSAPKKKGVIDVEKLPLHLKSEYYILAPLIREIAATNPTLIHLKSDEARYTSAQRIIELAEQRQAIFDRIDYFLEHGTEHPFYVEKEILHIDISKTESSKNTKPLNAPINGNNGFYEAQYKLKLARSMRSKLKNKPNRHADYKAVCEEIKRLENLIKNNQ